MECREAYDDHHRGDGRSWVAAPSGCGLVRRIPDGRDCFRRPSLQGRCHHRRNRNGKIEEAFRGRRGLELLRDRIQACRDFPYLRRALRQHSPRGRQETGPPLPLTISGRKAYGPMSRPARADWRRRSIHHPAHYTALASPEQQNGRQRDVRCQLFVLRRGHQWS